jgi:RNA polymerase sigma-70 factor (ECF subfamily)
MFLAALPLQLPFAGGAGGGAFALLDRVIHRPEEPMPSVAQATRVRALVDQHFGFVWRYLRGLGVPAADADDAAQQVFVVASQKIEAIAVGSERSFLVGTARGVAANARRGATRRREALGGDDLDALPDASPDAEARTGTQEELAVLDRFLASLPDDVRDVFILFELEGLTMAAIAEDLSLPPGTVASRLRRAREAFQEMVKRYAASRGRRGP